MQDNAFNGQFVCVTGGARGLGAAIVEMFARRGAHVFIADVLSQEGEELAGRLSDHRLSASFHMHDVASTDSWSHLVAAIRQKTDRLDILVNNAGIIIRKRLDSITREEWDRAFAINVTGSLLGMQSCRDLLRRSGAASIVNVSSTAGLIAHSDPSYTASKWALRGLTKAAALELAPEGIRVNSVHPATISTPLTAAAPAGHIEANRHAIPMGREASPEEVASVVLFLASSQSSFMTGSELAVDGGLSTGGVAHMRRAFQESFTN